MKVKFISNLITEDLIKKYNNPILQEQDFHFEIGEIYTVFGMYIEKNGGIVLDCLNMYSHLSNCPIDLFEVVDNRTSKYWRFGKSKLDDITFLPEEYYNNEYFHDDLSEDNPETVLQFHDMVRRFKEENQFDINN